MKETILLLVNAAIHLALGLLLLFFPFTLMGRLGVPIPDSKFYTSLLGAILLGIGLGLLVESVHDLTGIPGISLGGAASINICGAVTLIIWLSSGYLDLSNNGYTVLWVTAALLVGASVVDMIGITRHKRSTAVLSMRLSEANTGQAHLGKAIAIAAQAHQDQKDREGLPYILHPLRVMSKMENEVEQMAAILHDVVENTPWTMGGLKEEGFSKPVLKAVASLSRDPREPYQEYVDRLKKDTLAVKIKLADLEDNMDLRRLPELSDQNMDWIKRYHNHWLALRKAQNGNSS